ncbi:Flp1 family type IVb pilin [Acetivibrio clariflavus]|uniref:Flp1 family type IVb pilin n=1 Tax=Acetivibrio clariflavus TaxID=288965 RepID=UPI0031F51F6C
MTQLKFLGTYAKAKLAKWFSDEKGEVNIIATVVLMGIAVILAILFKEKVKELLGVLFEALTNNAKDAINNK